MTSTVDFDFLLVGYPISLIMSIQYHFNIFRDEKSDHLSGGLDHF